MVRKVKIKNTKVPKKTIEENIDLSSVDIDTKEIIATSPRVINDKTITHYIDLLNKICKTKDINNIALSGSYGTGKSSIIKSFCEKYDPQKQKSLVITIGSFLRPNLEKVEESKDNNLEKVEESKDNNPNFNDYSLSNNEMDFVSEIEKSILKQIIYTNSEEELPRSDLKRLKNENNKKKNILSTCYIVCYLITSFFLNFIYKNKETNFISYLINKINFNINDNWMFFIIIIIILSILFITCLCYQTYNFIYKIYNKSHIRKIKTNNYEFELDNKSDLPFTKQLYEIVYFFSKNNYEIIFFEDIDRFPEDITIKVVEELKEINTIINSSKMNRKKIKFVYSFKDDIFKTLTDKSKFYDYTLSIMPITSIYNSGVYLREHLNTKKKEQNISPLLIDVVSKYIIDMRTLINIVNDYDLFSDILCSKEHNKIFAMAVFKNYYIHEYGKILEANNQIDIRIRATKDKKNDLVSAQLNKIHNYTEKLEQYKQKVYDSQSDFKKLFIANNNKNDDFPTKIYINNKSYSISKFLNDDFDMSLFENGIVELYCNGYYFGEEKIFKKYGSKEDFLNEYNSIPDILKKYEKEIDECNNKIAEIKNSSLSDLFSQYMKNEKTKTDLLDELILNEFIEEDYIDYITLPVISSGITSNESKFIFNVKHNEYSLETRLENFDRLIKYLNGYFGISYVLNYSLVEYLIDNYKKYKKEYLDVINQYKQLDIEKLEFLYNLKTKNKRIFNKFIQDIINNDIDLWGQYIELGLIKATNYTDFLCMTLLKSQNSTHIMEHKDRFINILDILIISDNNLNNYIAESSVVRENIKTLNWRISNISFLTKDTIDFIFMNNLYKFTDINFRTIFKCNPKKMQYSLLEKDEYGKHFLDYVNTEFNLYGKEFYFPNSNFRLNYPGFINRVLKNKNLKLYLIKELYQRESFKINVNDITHDLYDEALKYNHIKDNWTSVKLLIHKVKNTDKLIEFIMESKNNLFVSDSINMINSIDVDFVKILLEKLIINHDYKQANVILKSKHATKIKYKKLDKYNDKVVKYLVENNLILFNNSNLEIIEKIETGKLLITYISNWYKEIDSIEKLFNKIKDDETIIEILLTAKFVSINEKMNILNKIYITTRNKATLLNKFKLVFKTNRKYQINYKYSIYRNVILNLSDYLSDISKDDKNISFVLNDLSENVEKLYLN